MQPEVRTYLFDIRKACDLILQFTAHKEFSDYEKDVLFRSAVERQFEIVGEAMSQMLKLEPSLGGRITNTRQIIAFRNILVHAYAQVKNQVVWGVIQSDLPMLRAEVDQLLKEGEPPE